MNKRIYALLDMKNGVISLSCVAEKPQDSIDKIRKAFNNYLAMHPKSSQPIDMDERIKMFHEFVGDRFCSVTIQKEMIKNAKD